MSKAKKTLDVDTIHAAAVADDLSAKHGEASQSVFERMAGSTVGFTDRKRWEEVVRKIEDQYCEKVHKSTPDAKTKGRGKVGDKNYVAPRWKYRTLLPVAWSSAKSVCGQAIDAGIKLDEDSRKTATEKALKEWKSEQKDPKSPREKFGIAMETARKILAQMDDLERPAVLKSYGIDPAIEGNEFNWHGE